MTFSVQRSLFIVFAIVLSGSNGRATTADCTDAKRTVQMLVLARDFESAIKAKRNVGRYCEPRDLFVTEREIALGLLASSRASGSPSAALELLEQSASLGGAWEAAEALGAALAAQKDYVGAARAYQRAYAIVEQTTLFNIPVQSNLKTTLLTKSDEFRHLAASDGVGKRAVFVPATITRATEMRAIEATRIPVPILFEYNSDQFTGPGREAAEELLTQLKESQPKEIVVTGHTDRIGSDEFNLRLSMRRAQRVLTFLQSAGISGKIRAVGKGKSEPRTVEQPNQFTQAELDALNRRVEFDWKF